MTEMTPSPMKKQKNTEDNGEPVIRIRRMRNFRETEEKLSVVKFSTGMKSLFNEMREKIKKPPAVTLPNEAATYLANSKALLTSIADLKEEEERSEYQVPPERTLEEQIQDSMKQRMKLEYM
jgi:hypothetical protein